MKRSILTLLILMTPMGSFLNAQLKIMSYNIRLDNPNDGNDRWELRKEELCELLVEEAPDFIGLQEAMPGQVDYIDRQLQDYAFIGFGRDGKGSDSEAVPIFFNSLKYKLLKSEVFWLSPTPEVPSKGWDAALNRITTYGTFVNRQTKDTIHLFNTHFDHRGEKSREKAAELILKKISEMSLNDEKVVVMGDLNSEPHEAPVRILNNSLSDAFEVSREGPAGPIGTFNAFDTDAIPDRRIDYIFCKNLSVLNYFSLDAKRTNKRWISDHLPVLVELKQ